MFGMFSAPSQNVNHLSILADRRPVRAGGVLLRGVDGRARLEDHAAALGVEEGS